MRGGHRKVGIGGVMGDGEMEIPVVVTEEEYRKAEEIFVGAEQFQCAPAPAAEAAFAEVARRIGAKHAVLGPAPYRNELYAALPKGGVLARFGVGHDGVDKQQAAAAGLLCTNTPGALDDSVAEYAFALLLAAARHIGSGSAAMKEGRWTPATGMEISGKRLAIIGCGPIGRRAAQIASRGFGMKVSGWKRTPVDLDEWHDAYGYERVTTDFTAAVEGADFVLLLIPGVPETRNFINAERLARIPAGAWLINAARGSVMDEAALFETLRAGGLRGAAIDVYQQEPYEPGSPDQDLRTLDNVLLMPHCGSNTVEANHKMARQALHNLVLAEEGRFAEMDLVGVPLS
jgi:phosphoglycerate dehydrogenase-like enzyme